MRKWNRKIAAVTLASIMIINESFICGLHAEELLSEAETCVEQVESIEYSQQNAAELSNTEEEIKSHAESAPDQSSATELTNEDDNTTEQINENEVVQVNTSTTDETDDHSVHMEESEITCNTCDTALLPSPDQTTATVPGTETEESTGTQESESFSNDMSAESDHAASAETNTIKETETESNSEENPQSISCDEVFKSENNAAPLLEQICMTESETTDHPTDQQSDVNITVTLSGVPCILCVDVDHVCCYTLPITEQERSQVITVKNNTYVRMHILSSQSGSETEAGDITSSYVHPYLSVNAAETDICSDLATALPEQLFLQESCCQEIAFDLENKDVCIFVTSYNGAPVDNEDTDKPAETACKNKTEEETLSVNDDIQDTQKGDGYPVIFDNDQHLKMIIENDSETFLPGEIIEARIVAMDGYAIDEIRVTSEGDSIDVETSTNDVSSLDSTVETGGITYDLADDFMTEAEIIFEMPAAAVYLFASATPLKDEQGISKISIDFVVNEGITTALPSAFAAPGCKLMGTYFKVYFYDKSGNVITFPNGKNYRYGQCMNPGAANPVAEYSTGNVFLEGTSDAMFSVVKSNTLLAKAFYYLYEGPAFGQEIDSVNLEKLFEEWGCSGEGQKFALSRWVMVRAFEGKNFAEKETFSEEGLKRIEQVIDILKSYPTPVCEFSSSALQSSYDAKRDLFISDTVTYNSFSNNKINLTLPKGITLVKSNGDSYTGSATLKGGTSFHLEKKGSDKSEKSTINGTPDYASDYYGITLNNAGKQTVGFSYYGNSNISLNVTWPDKPLYLYLKKESRKHGSVMPNANYSLNGAVYDVYDADGKVIGSLTTDASGITSSMKVPKAGTYTAREKTPPKGYQLSSNVISVNVTASNTETSPALLQAYDDEITGRITVRKTFDTAKYISIKAFTDTLSLTGAVYGLYDAAGKEIASLTTGNDGTVTSAALEMGTYTIKEKSAPTGFSIDQKSYPVSISAEQLNPVVISNEEPALGRAQLYKSVVANANGENDPSGYMFRLVNVSNSSLYIDFPATDANGYTFKDQIPIGTYRLEERNLKDEYAVPALPQNIVIREYKTASDLVSISTNAQPIINSPVEYPLIIHKTDTQTGSPLYDAVFEIVPFKNGTEGNPVALTVKEGKQIDATHFATNENGLISFKENLKGGNYLLRETDAPDDYTIADPVPFTISKSFTDVSINVTDKPFTGKIRIRKTIPDQTDPKEDPDHAVNEPANETYQDQLPENNMYSPGIGYIFTISVKEDIKDQRGNIRSIDDTPLTAGTIVSQIYTDENGIASSEDLYCGQYQLKESAIDADSGLTLSSNTFDFEISEAAVCDIPFLEYDFENNWNHVRILKKSSYDGSALQGITFTCKKITAENAESDTDDQEQSADEPVLCALPDMQEDTILTAVTDQNGLLSFTGLSQGNYIIEETKTIPGYNLDPSPVTFTVDENGLIDGKDELFLERYNTPNTLVIHKYDAVKGENSDELPGASLSLFDENGNCIDSWISGDDGVDENGHVAAHTCVALIPGTYMLKETICPPGYEPVNSEITFQILDSFEVQKVCMSNAPYRDTEISKKSLVRSPEIGDEWKEGAELPGASMQLKDADGNIIENWISSDTPHMMKLHAGTYTLTETLPAKGYTTAESITFTIHKREKEGDMQIEKVTMYDQPTVISVSKTDITDASPVIGAEMIILDSAGNEVARWITAQTPHEIQALPIGTYTLIERTAPDGYETAEKVTFEVNDTTQIQKVVMYDKRSETETSSETETETPHETESETIRESEPETQPETIIPPTPQTPTKPDAPKTGDHSPVAVYMILMITSLLLALIMLCIRISKEEP